MHLLNKLCIWWKLINETKSYRYPLLVCEWRLTRLRLHCIIWDRSNESPLCVHTRYMQKASVWWMMLEHKAGTVPLPCRTRTQPSPLSPTDVFCAFPAATFRHTQSGEKEAGLKGTEYTDGSREKRKSPEPIKTVFVSWLNVKTDNFPRGGDLAGQTHPVLQPEEGTWERTADQSQDIKLLFLAHFKVWNAGSLHLSNLSRQGCLERSHVGCS